MKMTYYLIVESGILILEIILQIITKDCGISVHKNTEVGNTFT